jgi:myo-inositol-1-phosphate synthase
MGIRIAVVGVGNCASALVQGLHFYGKKGQDTSGLMEPDIGGYHPGDVEVVAAFDVDARKVGRDLADAIFAEPNCTFRFCEVPFTGVRLQRGPTLDGIGSTLRDVVPESLCSPVDVVEALRRANVDVVVGYLPVGSEEAVRFYADAALAAGCAYVNCIPVFLASDPEYAKKFTAAGLPLIGDDIKSQVGATIVHRTLVDLMHMRGVQLTHTSQLNVGGNTDFLNMLDRSRLKSKKISKTRAVTSAMGITLPARDVHIGPSDHVEWLDDHKWCFITLEGVGYGGAPMDIELKMRVWDSPNSAGVVTDAIRCAKVALDRHEGGPLISPSAYFMKSPPVQVEDHKALENLRAWLTR